MVIIRKLHVYKSSQQHSTAPAAEAVAEACARGVAEYDAVERFRVHDWLISCATKIDCVLRGWNIVRLLQLSSTCSALEAQSSNGAEVVKNRCE
jgi:hypothetical protein